MLRKVKMKNGVSKVYTDRPDYADFDSPAKFEAIKSIIAKRLIEHPNAICSYSGGSDSDIMLDLIERTRAMFELPPIKYVFFNTGLEMKATRDHVKCVAEKYGVEIEERRPEINIVRATRKYGIPFVSKIMSGGLSEWQKKEVPLSIADEYDQAEDNQIIFRGMNDDRQREKLKSITFPLGYIPFWRLDYNKKQFSGLKPIKGLIDDYDIMQCGLSNNLKDFDTPLYVVKGFQGDNLDELQQNLKTKKIVGTDSEGDVEVRTVDIPYQARKAKADEDEKNIYRFGMGFNSSQVGDGNITNIVIKSRYALLDLKANKLERRLKRLLKQLLKVILDEINQMHGTGYKISDVKFEFTRSIMMNESENIANEKTEADIQQVRINTILNMAAQIGDEQTLKALCDVMDWDFDELKEQLKNADSSTAQDARTALGAIVPDDPDNPDDEPVEE